MKSIISIITAGIITSSIAIAGPWVPISVNTNTWECKPSGATFTNFWNDIAAGSATPTTPTTPTSTPPISVQSPYYTAEMWYDFVVDNGTGTNITDATGNGEDGDEVSSLPIAYNQPLWVDYSVTFDKTAKSAVDTKTTALLYGASRVSIAFWVRLNSNVIVADVAYLFKAKTANTGGFDFLIQHAASTAQNSFYANDGDSVTSSATPFVLPIDEWVHVALTRESTGNMVVYTNGTIASTDAVTGGSALYIDTVMHIGGQVSIAPVTTTEVSVDDFAAWSRILTTSEITAIYNNGRSTNALWYSESEW